MSCSWDIDMERNFGVLLVWNLLQVPMSRQLLYGDQMILFSKCKYHLKLVVYLVLLGSSGLVSP